MNQEEKQLQDLNKEFTSLNEMNRENIVNMTKFLVLTQDTIIPEMLTLRAKEKDTEK
jgi:hypothetical protein